VGALAHVGGGERLRQSATAGGRAHGFCNAELGPLNLDLYEPLLPRRGPARAACPHAKFARPCRKRLRARAEARHALAGGAPPDAGRSGEDARLSAFLDTNVLIRHLTGDPPDQARRATAFLERAEELLVPDLIVAEVVYVLESFYEVERQRVAELVRAIIGFRAIAVVDQPLLLRALEVYEVDRLHFAEAYLVASAEASGVRTIASFDREIDRVATVQRLEPA